MKHKFKPGDKVVVLDGSKIQGYTGGWSMPEFVGKTYVIKKATLYCAEPAYFLKGDDVGYFFDERGLAAASDTERHEIIIYRNGQTVVALDKKAKRSAKAICSPDDTFDFMTGAKLALERLSGEKTRRISQQTRPGANSL